MKKALTIAGIAALTPALIWVFARVIALGLDEIRAGNRGSGLAIIAGLVAIVAAGLPWYLL